MTLIKHDNMLNIDSDAILWRYFSFEKFESLLKTESLFFCRADKFSDPFEGTITKEDADNEIEVERRVAKCYNQTFEESAAQARIGIKRNQRQKYRRCIVVNCWHENANESDAMWRLYLKDNEGVAIQTNAQRIANIIDKTSVAVFPSKVRYIDYDLETFYHVIDYPHPNYNIYVPFIHKRKEFIHESEFRLFHEVPDALSNENYWDHQPNEKGVFVPVDLNTLVEKIYFAPTVEDKVISKIKDLTLSHGYNFEFHKSKLSNDPNY